ncbi:hypothetical protein Bca4012_010025 [Brassica carinata]
MGNLLKSKEVTSSSDMQVGSTSADVHTQNEVNDGETDLTEDEIILMRVAEIEAVYASNGFGMREVDGTACEVQNKVDTTEDSALEEAEDDDDEDYDYNLWHDFVGRNCEWDDDKDEDGGVGGGARTNVTYGGIRGEVATKARSGRTNPSSNKGSGSSTNKQRTANPPSTFEDYVDDGRDYIGSSSNCVYANYKIPTKCICGGAITVETDERGRNYYVCKDFKNDGLHIRHDCLAALEEELDCLRSQYAEEVSLRREEIKELKQLIMVGR